METKRKLVVAERITVGAQRGWWMSRDYAGGALAARRTKKEALRAGLPYALEKANKACCDLSLFDTEVP